LLITASWLGFDRSEQGPDGCLLERATLWLQLGVQHDRVEIDVDRIAAALRDAGVCDAPDLVTTLLVRRLMDDGTRVHFTCQGYRLTVVLDWIEGPASSTGWQWHGTRYRCRLAGERSSGSPVLAITLARCPASERWRAAELAAVADAAGRLRAALPAEAPRTTQIAPRRVTAGRMAPVHVAALRMPGPGGSTVVVIATGAFRAGARARLLRLVLGPRPAPPGAARAVAARFRTDDARLAHLFGPGAERGPGGHWIIQRGRSGAPTLTHSSRWSVSGEPELHLPDRDGRIAYLAAWSRELGGAVAGYEAAPPFSAPELRAVLRAHDRRGPNGQAAHYVREGTAAWWELSHELGGLPLVLCEAVLFRTADLRRFAVAFAGRATTNDKT
jgi:hypothetical protein